MELPFLAIIVLMTVASSPAPQRPSRLRGRGYWGPFYRTQTWRRPEAVVRESRP